MTASFGSDVMANVVGGLILVWILQWNFTRVMAIATIVAASLNFPLVLLGYTVMSARFFADLCFAFMLAAVFTGSALAPFKSVRMIAFVGPLGFMALLSWANWHIGQPEFIHGFLAAYPVPFTFITLILMVMWVVLVTRAAPEKRAQHRFSLDLSPTN